MKTLQELTRPNIWKLKPYSSARDEYKGYTASVFLDANENPYNTPHNRYPDPMQCELKTLLSKIKKVSPEHIFLGNGSDEAIDLVFRAFCEPGKDNVVAIDPTYGMYQVCADVNDVEYRKVLLDDNFQFSANKLLAAADEHTKLIFLCSPNNPTGNDLIRSEIETLLREFEGLVILDEAYSDFSDAPSFCPVQAQQQCLLIAHHSPALYSFANSQPPLQVVVCVSPHKGYITARPKGRYRKLCHWSAIKRYSWNLLFLIPQPALLYISALLHL